MSMDNGYIIRQNAAGRYVLQMYFSSADEYPDVEDPKAPNYETLEEACRKYGRMETEANDYGYPLDEYGLKILVN